MKFSICKADKYLQLLVSITVAGGSSQVHYRGSGASDSLKLSIQFFNVFNSLAWAREEICNQFFAPSFQTETRRKKHGTTVYVKRRSPVISAIKTEKVVTLSQAMCSVSLQQLLKADTWERFKNTEAHTK